MIAAPASSSFGLDDYFIVRVVKAGKTRLAAQVGLQANEGRI
jgi:hypothetical protein